MLHHLRQLEIDGPAAAVSVSGDGSLIAVGTKVSSTLIDVGSGRQLRRIPADAVVTGLAISSDNSVLAVATGAPTVRVYDCKSGKLIHQLIRRIVPDFLRTQRQVQVAFLPNSPTLITRGEPSPDVTYWNCESGVWENLIRMPHRSGSVVISPDGMHVSLVSEPAPNAYRGHVTMYRVNHGLRSIWNSWHESDQRVTAAAFSSNGKQFVSYAPGDEIRIWSVDTGQHIASIDEPAKNLYLGVAFVCDVLHLLTIETRTIAVRRLGQENALASESSRQPGNIRGFGTSTDGTVVVTFNANAAMDVWKVDTPAAAGN